MVNPVSPLTVRRRALKLMGVGLAMGVVWVALLLVVEGQGRNVLGPGLGLPGLPLVVGLVELVSGRSFDDLARSWDELTWWQRGLLGTVIVALATLVFIVTGGMIAIALS
jgi:hypothetical protein